ERDRLVTDQRHDRLPDQAPRLVEGDRASERPHRIPVTVLFAAWKTTAGQIDRVRQVTKPSAMAIANSAGASARTPTPRPSRQIRCGQCIETNRMPLTALAGQKPQRSDSSVSTRPRNSTSSENADGSAPAKFTRPRADSAAA